jgi:hypothetical protein
LDGLKVPEPLAAIVTVPPGLVGVALLSVTVARQLVAVPTTRVPGVQVTVVVVVWMAEATITGSQEPVAALLFASPGYVAVKPKVPVILNRTAREFGIVPVLEMVTIETMLGVPEQTPEVTVGKSWYVTVPLG